MLDIQSYYRNKCILITGGTGLLGKVLLESFLRKLPSIQQIYVLIRAREDVAGDKISAEKRLREELVETSLMDGIRAREGKSVLKELIQNKVTAVEGDITRPRMGLEERWCEEIRENLDVLIHSAALTQFDAPVDRALETNTKSVRRILDFARNCRKQPFIAHVSTCYVNNRGGPVPETPLSPDAPVHPSQETRAYEVEEEISNLEKTIERIRNHEVDRLDRRLWLSLKQVFGNLFSDTSYDTSGEGGIEKRREQWIQNRLVKAGLQAARRRGWNDTYTYTKAMGEQIFSRDKGNIPGLILRPSIIESSWQSPAPGWLNGFRMLDPLIVSYGRGQLFEFPGNPDAIMDIIPADFTANALIAAIPNTHHHGGPPVYQVASGTENPLRLGDLLSYIDHYFQENPLVNNSSGDSLPGDFKFPRTDPFLRRVDFRYLLPLKILSAALTPLTFFSWGERTKSRMNSRYRAVKKLRYHADLYGPYAEFQHQFLTANTRDLYRSMSPEEQNRFPFDVKELDWKHYFEDVHMPGVKKYLLGIEKASVRTSRTPVRMPKKQVRESAPGRESGSKFQAPEVIGEKTNLDPGQNEGKNTPEQRVETEKKGNRSEEDALSRTSIPGCFYRNEGGEHIQNVTEWTGHGIWKKTLHGLSMTTIRLVCRYYLNATYQNQDHIPKRGPFILASNHSSHADTGVLLSAVHDRASRVHPVAASDYWFENNVIGWFVHNALNAIPFDRTSRDIREAMRLPVEILKQGHSLIFYPEGGRSEGEKVTSFKNGIGVLALASGAPVIPAYVQRTHRVMPKGKATLKRVPVTAWFGQPIHVGPYLERLSGHDGLELAREMTEQVQDAVESLQDEATS